MLKRSLSKYWDNSAMYKISKLGDSDKQESPKEPPFKDESVKIEEQQKESQCETKEVNKNDVDEAGEIEEPQKELQTVKYETKEVKKNDVQNREKKTEKEKPPDDMIYDRWHCPTSKSRGLNGPLFTDRWNDVNLGRWNRLSGEVIQPITGMGQYVERETRAAWITRVNLTHNVNYDELPDREGLI